MAKIMVYEIATFPINKIEPTFMLFSSFEDDENQIITNKEAIIGFIERKLWFDKTKGYLVLHPTHTFTINFSG